MTKDETRQLKGLAILMMLWLHLFSDEEVVLQCHYWLTYVNGLPLAYSLTRLASCCVAIYIFLGGYGLAATYQQDNRRLQGFRRALSLMVNFWLIFLLFVPLGCWVNPDRYPGDALTFLLNITAIGYSYNGAWWFLLPYVLLTLSAHFVISRAMVASRWMNALWLGTLAVVYVAVYLVKSNFYITDVEPIPGVSTLLNFLSMLFLFGLGVIAVKYQWITRLRQRLERQSFVEIVFWLVVLCSVKMVIGASSLLNVPFILLFIPLLLALHWPSYVGHWMEYLGTHSTNMWLIHYFYYYIFGNLIYQLRYPLLMFVCLTVASVACSYVVQALFTPLRKRIRGK